MFIRQICPSSFKRRPIVCSAWPLAAAIVGCWLGLLTAPVQSQIPQASLTSVTGAVRFYRSVAGRLGPVALKRGELLQLGDVVDTGRGSVVIAMQDGSQVIVYPNSRVVLKDFNTVSSGRELLEVLVGRIRVKINHYGKRPNPYRIYSPVASIAVRGTEFLVSVESSTETRVLVFSGLVEVRSLINPQQSALVRPGRDLVVRPDGDISMVTAAPRGELNEIRSLRSGWPQTSNLNTAYRTHETNSTDLRPSRFTAFNDSHLDSLQNPAYATEFREPSGRLFLVPSFSPKFVSLYRYVNSDRQPTSITSLNYTLSPQLSYFAPLGSKWVAGGGVAVTKTEIGGAETEGPYRAGGLRAELEWGQAHGRYFPPDPPGARHLPDESILYFRHDGNVKFTTTNVSFLLARRFGEAERTSLGIQSDYTADRSSYGLDSNWSTATDSQHEKSRTRNRRLGWSAGLTHDFGHDKKLGVYYRYRTESIGSQSGRIEQWSSIELKSFINGNYHDFGWKDGHLSEAGALFRGSLTRRLFYGVNASGLFGRYQDRDLYPFDNGTYQTANNNRQVRSVMVDAGIGFALRPRTVLSVDLSNGRSSEDYRYTGSHSVPGVTISGSDGNSQLSFRSWHFGGQTDVWRKLFAGASLFLVRERTTSRSIATWPEGYDGILSEGALQNFSRDSYSSSNFSAGWRLTPVWTAQYVYFTSFGRNSPSHSIVIRREFGKRSGGRE
ncbi:MAG TPA: FecR family protein [Blastocatellia bacterium]|nr:FecR family protein [Blastocatellia bacterium]